MQQSGYDQYRANNQNQPYDSNYYYAQQQNQGYYPQYGYNNNQNPYYPQNGYNNNQNTYYPNNNQNNQNYRPNSNQNNPQNEAFENGAYNTNVNLDTPEYDKYWANADAFRPQTFSENVKESKTYNDILFAILFFLQLLGTVAILLYAYFTFEKESKSNRSVQEEINLDTSSIVQIFVISFIIGLVVNIAHFIYALSLPKFYITFGLIVGFIFTLVVGLMIIFLAKTILGAILPILSLIFTVILYWFMRKYIKFSACVFKQTCKIILRHPCVLFFTFIFMIFNSAVSVFFFYTIFIIQVAQISNYLYIYVVFSYFWTYYTLYYVMYLTIAGVAGTWYFLTDTEYYPSSPVWQSFKRAATTSFGSASVAGFLLAIVNTIQFLVQSSTPDTTCGAVTRCIGLCLLNIIEAIVSTINRFGLIYCALFGIPYSAGCKRFVKLSAHEFCQTILSSCVVSTAVNYNMFIFSLAAGGLGYFFGWLFYRNKEAEAIFKIGILIGALLFSLAIFAITTPVLLTIADTIIVCYAEHPERLKTTASELNDIFQQLYQGNVF